MGKLEGSIETIVSEASTRDLLIFHAVASSGAMLKDMRDRSAEALKAAATELARRIDEPRAK